MSSVGIGNFLDALEAAPDIELHSLMILRHGAVLAEGWWAPYRPDEIHLLYSLSKSFTSTAAGFAVAEGLLSLDDRVISFFPELNAEVSHPWLRSLRVRDLAAMATGHRLDTLEEAFRTSPVDLVRGMLSIEPEAEPGTLFAYNNTATYTLGAIIQQLTGGRLTDYLRPRLFEPLGIEPTYWDTDGTTREIGFSGLHLTTESIAKFGQLYLQDGVWDGKQLLPAGWVAEATRLHTPNPGEPNPDWQQGYSFQFWRSRHGYRGDGAYGQFCLVWPEQDAVVITTAQTENMQGMLDAAWAHLLPAFDAPASVDHDQLLADRLAQMSIPTEIRASTSFTDPLLSADSWVTATGVVDHEQGWTLTLDDHGRAIGVTVGDGQWVRTPVPMDDHGTLVVEGTGAWLSPSVFAAELIMVQTPHRLQVRFDLATGVSSSQWQTVPIGRRSLVELATPIG